MLEYIYIHYKKIRPVHLLLLWFVEIISYQFTDSNSGVIVLSLSVLSVLCERYYKNFFASLSAKIIKYGHILFSLIFLELIIIYPSLSGAAKTAWETINTFFNGRLLYGAYTYDTHGLTFLGRFINFPDKVYWNGHWMDLVSVIVFDNYYLGQLVLFGTVSLIMISLALFIVEKDLESRDRIILISYIFYGIMEAYVITLVYCFALMVVGKYLHRHFDRRSPHERMLNRRPGL